MNKTLKEMLLQHKPITEQAFDIEAMGGESFEKERESDGYTPESIASLHNVSVQDILDQIEKGIKVEREHTTDEAEARIIAMDHLVELPDYYTRLDKMEEEGLQELEQEKKSLKEKLKLIKSGMFLNEESADVASLRNKISQGLKENIVLDDIRSDATILWSDSLSKSERNFLDKYYLIGEDYSNGNYIIECKKTGVIYSLDLHNGPEINSSSIHRIASSRKEIGEKYEK